MAVFWTAALYSLEEVYRLFSGTCCLYQQGDEVEAASTSETSVHFYQTTQR
jgi:hypothetical protein